MSYMRNAILFRKSEVPCVLEGPLCSFPPERTQSFAIANLLYCAHPAHSNTTVLPRPAQRNRGPGPSFALAAHSMVTLASVQGEAR
jgi:hypothetical protein